MSDITELKVIHTSHTTTTRKPISDDEWDRGTTHTSHSIEGIAIGSDYHGLNLPGKVNNGDVVWLVYAVYSTGDSFGNDDDAECEFFTVHRDEAVAKYNAKLLSSVNSKSSQYDSTVYLSLDDGTQLPTRPPWVARMTDVADAIRSISKSEPPKYTIIPAGYRLTVTSWENDADNYRTMFKEGLSLEQVKLDLELCQLLLSEYGPTGYGFGNLLDDDSIHDYQVEILKVLNKHKDILPNDVDLDEEMDEDDPYSSTSWFDYVQELNSEYFGNSEGYITRVFESCKVEYISDDIKLEDVTDQFEVK